MAWYLTKSYMLDEYTKQGFLGDWENGSTVKSLRNKPQDLSLHPEHPHKS